MAIFIHFGLLLGFVIFNPEAAVLPSLVYARGGQQDNRPWGELNDQEKRERTEETVEQLDEDIEDLEDDQRKAEEAKDEAERNGDSEGAANHDEEASQKGEAKDSAEAELSWWEQVGETLGLW